MSDQQHIPGTPSSNGEQQAQSEAVQQRLPLPGAILANERQARGWSVEYVAGHLKLAIRQVHALEEDRYEALPSPVVIRGFIRIYAKMLGIDSAALVAGLPSSTTPAEVQIMSSRTLSTPFSESSLPLRGQHELPLARIAWIALGVVVIVAVLAGLKYGNWAEIRNSSLAQRLHLGGSESKPQGAATAGTDNMDPAAKPAVVADSESSVPSEAVSAAPAAFSGSATSATSAASAEATPTPPSVPAPASAPAATASAAAAAAGAAPNTAMTPAPATPLVAANLANPLQLTITQDSWVEIRRPDKTVVVSRIMKAGATEAFDVNGPMSMIVGNAAGVEATLRGKPLALGSTTSNNVARLDLK
ncbi:MAG TPA: RodZ domain-containing protein [Herbaspirillum sp.]|jgi:cytoskeleton protein RodZ